MSSATSHPLHVCAHVERSSRTGKRPRASIPRQGPYPGVVPHGRGPGATREADSRPHRAVRTAAQGLVLVPVPTRGPQIGSRGLGRLGHSGRDLSRRCRAGRARRGPTGGPSSSDGPCGPRTSISVTVPSPSSSLSRRTTVGASSFIWVAHAVESVRTSELAVVERTRAGSAGRPRARPGSSQRENTPCTRTSVPQPWSAISRPIVRVEQLGVALVGVRPGGLRVGPAARRAELRGRSAARRTAPGPGPAIERAMLRARSSPVSSCSTGSGGWGP